VLLEQRKEPVLDGQPGWIATGTDLGTQGAPSAAEIIPVPLSSVLYGANTNYVIVRRS
jgi:hypothetical protein